MSSDIQTTQSTQSIIDTVDNTNTTNVADNVADNDADTVVDTTTVANTKDKPKRKRLTKKELQRIEQRRLDDIESKKRNHMAITDYEEFAQFVFDSVHDKEFSLRNNMFDPNCGIGELFLKFIDNDIEYNYRGMSTDYNGGYGRFDFSFNLLKVKHCKIYRRNYMLVKETFHVPTVICNPIMYMDDYDDIPEDYIGKYKSVMYRKEGKDYVYLDFVKKCFRDATRELILLVPKEFMNSEKSAPIIMNMLKEGAFTNFHFPTDEEYPYDTVGIRFEYNRHQSDTVTVNDDIKRINIHRGVIRLSDIPVNTDNSSITRTPVSTLCVEDLFSVYTGLVSGCDSVFKYEYGNTFILVDEDIQERYIYLEEPPNPSTSISNHLNEHKSKLLARDKKYNEDNWFEWKSTTNIEMMRRKKDFPCIYIKTSAKKTPIAFLDRVQLFNSSLLCLIPKRGVTMDKYKLLSAIKYFNTDEFKEQFISPDGKIRVGIKQLMNCIVPGNILELVDKYNSNGVENVYYNVYNYG
jgi:hypothetical protein